MCLVITYANGDILRSREKPVDQDAHEGRVKTKLNWQFGELGICHALRHDDSPDGDTCDDCQLSGVSHEVYMTDQRPNHRPAIEHCNVRSSGRTETNYKHSAADLAA